MEIVINDPREIPKLLNEIHDGWFALDDLKPSLDRGEITVPIAFKQEDLKHVEGQKAFLTVDFVAKVEIEDTERVGFYDINNIAFDPENGCITISCGIPIAIRIFVDKFQLSLRKNNLFGRGNVGTKRT